MDPVCAGAAVAEISPALTVPATRLQTVDADVIYIEWGARKTSVAPPRYCRHRRQIGLKLKWREPRGLLGSPGFSCEVVFGGDLLSHTLASAVPSALAGLASGFGMGPGVSLPLWPP